MRSAIIQASSVRLANSSYVTQAHAQGKQVWGLINDFGKGIKLSKVLGVTSNRNRLVNGLVATAIQHELDGINIDFEHVTKRYCTGISGIFT